MKVFQNCNNMLLRAFMVFYGLVSFIGCSDPARLIGTEPPAGEIEYFEPELTLHFDKPVSVVWVNDAEAQPMCSPPTRDWQISLHQRQFVDITWPSSAGTHPEKEVCFAVRYTDETGTHEQELCTLLPGISVQPPELEIMESSVKDGDKGVDPAPLNTNGITFQFFVMVAGTIEIRMENGTSLGWIARWNKSETYGDSVTIFPRPGEELVNGTTYIIQINVSDAGGFDKLIEEITFTTKE